VVVTPYIKLTRVVPHIVENLVDLSVGTIFVGSWVIAPGGEFKIVGIMNKRWIK
jgi:hypothetical protein